MERRLLTKNDFKKLHEAFSLAFSKNKVPFTFTEEEFDYRIHKKLNIDYELSGGAFDGSELIGFILHSSNIYEGIPTAFNAGTGVIPGFRNQNTGEELYEFLLPKIIAKSLARVILEVIDTNETAIHLYEKIGFSFRRRFLCYKQMHPMQDEPKYPIENGTLQDVDEDFTDYVPSFADSINQLQYSEETVFIAKKDGEAIGYVIFQPSLGRISQLAVARLYREEGIGRALIFAALKAAKKPLTIMNIPENEFGMHRFLKKCGFENQVNQFEMELII